MKFMQTEKKQLLIYVIIAYGITYVMGLLMWYSYGKGLDLSAFPNAQMLYPAAGVMMAYLITKKGDKNLPTAFYIFFVALTAVLVVCTAASVLAPQNRDLMSMPYSQWAPIMNYVIIIFQSCKSSDCVHLGCTKAQSDILQQRFPHKKSKQHYSRKHYQPSKQISLSELTLFPFCRRHVHTPSSYNSTVCLPFFYENLYTKTLFFSNRNPHRELRLLLSAA